MKLADLRKLSIRKNLKIHFQLPNGMECIVNEHGVAQIPALRRVPDFNLENELGSISEFILESAVVNKKSAPQRTTVGREEIAAMLTVSPSGPQPEHEEE